MHILQAIRVKYKYTNKSFVVILFRWSLWTHIQTHIHPNTHTHTYPLSPHLHKHMCEGMYLSLTLSLWVLHAVCMLFVYSVDSGDPHLKTVSGLFSRWKIVPRL